ncbi:MAG: hypothetical protein QOD07_1416 [Frankiaceae bacterium]|jgi:hypothetical protein|nr:hypothetical protein [Frankiaceae bacterium]
MSDRCRHELLPGQCALCRPIPAGVPATVYVTRGGEAYHGTPRCAGLADGQWYAEYRGNEVHAIEPISAAAAIVKGRSRCLVCLPE